MSIGLLLTPNYRRRPAHDPEFVWAADNGCFQPSGWTVDRWWQWLVSERANTHSCLFAVAPDVVGNAEETLAQASIWLPRIRSLGFKAAFVAQDGSERYSLPWNNFDVLFIGGSTHWKLSSHAFTLAQQAKAKHKFVHMGRVNSGKRWRLATSYGCDTADGTFFTYGPKTNFERFKSWPSSQLSLFDSCAASDT